MAFTFTKRTKTSSRPALHGGMGHQMATDPFLDWVIIFSVGSLLALALVGFGASVYLGLGTGNPAPVVPSGRSAAAPFDEAALDKVLSGFDSRAAQHASVLGHWNPPADPSAP